MIGRCPFSRFCPMGHSFMIWILSGKSSKFLSCLGTSTSAVLLVPKIVLVWFQVIHVSYNSINTIRNIIINQSRSLYWLNTLSFGRSVFWLNTLSFGRSFNVLLGEKKVSDLWNTYNTLPWGGGLLFELDFDSIHMNHL